MVGSLAGQCALHISQLEQVAQDEEGRGGGGGHGRCEHQEVGRQGAVGGRAARAAPSGPAHGDVLLVVVRNHRRDLVGGLERRGLQACGGLTGGAGGGGQGAADVRGAQRQVQHRCEVRSVLRAQAGRAGHVVSLS
ncbi:MULTISPECIES: hypothetical protein [Streptomyces]|uniref:hypothetical protein n=1 Tax=Streptomyces TaxID=1883 RepID=UPI0014887C85|nr:MULTISPECIES: hypothetical protein [Streptomyces]